VNASPAVSATTCNRTGEEWLAEFLLERLRRQYDWNVGLNGRASTLLALTGIAFSLLLGREIVGFEEGFGFDLVARVAGLALFLASAGMLLLAVRRRPEAVWGNPDLGEFVARHRGVSGEEVSAALVDRLLEGTTRNEVVLAGKSREIEFGTALTLAALVSVALGSFGNDGTILFAGILGVALVALVLRISTRLFFDAPSREQF
jgi:hypothetical protein